jgi:hypothetical protein
MSDREHDIRVRAHQLWEEEGRPDGREHDHWHQAEAEIGAQEQGPAAAVEVVSPVKVDSSDVTAPTPKPVTAGTAKMPAGAR